MGAGKEKGKSESSGGKDMIAIIDQGESK